MMISLARAFKERSRLTQRIQETIHWINMENSVMEGKVRSIDVRKKYEEFHALCRKLTALKQAISHANAGITDKLVELTEQKHLLNWIREIPAGEGKEQAYSRMSGSTVVEFKTAEIKKGEIIEEMEVIQKRINQLQDEIDEFNARTRIEFEP